MGDTVRFRLVPQYNDGMSEQVDKMKPTKRKRSYLRYSLRTFLVLLTVFSVWLGLLVHDVNKQKNAVQWVRDLDDIGCEVYYDFEWDANTGGRVNDADPPGPDWLRELIGVDYFADVVKVDVNYTEVSDLRPLRALNELRELDISGTERVSDFTPLRELTELRWLYLANTQVSDVGPLRELKQLRVLSLVNTQVSDVKPLANLSRLRHLMLHGAPVSDVSPLVGNKGLTIHLFAGWKVTVPEEMQDRVKRWGYKFSYADHR